MKIINLLLTVAITFFLGCQAPTDHHQPAAQINPPVENNNDGGMCGGGGETFVKNPIEVKDVVKLLYNAKKQLRLYINFQRKYYDSLGNDLKLKYYLGDANLGTYLEKTDLEVLTDRECKDLFGRSVDASIYASKPNTICLSAFRLAPKLIAETANKEIIALLIHELSHLMGSSEADADILQQRVLNDYQSVSDQQLEDLRVQSWDVVQSLNKNNLNKQAVSNAIAQNDMALVKTHADVLYNSILNSNKALSRMPFSYIDYPVRDWQKIILAQIKLVNYYLESPETYEKCFNGQMDVTIQEMADSCFPELDRNIFSGYLFPKLEKKSDIEYDLYDAYLFSAQLAQHINAIMFNNPLPFISYPTHYANNSDWTIFYGSYTAQLLKCQGTSDFENLNKLQISSLGNSDKLLSVAENKDEDGVLWSEFYLQHHPKSEKIYNGAGDLIYTLKVEKNKNQTSIINERGSRWFNTNKLEWSKLIKTIEKNENGFKLYITKEWYLNDYINPLREGRYSCEYDLARE